MFLSYVSCPFMHLAPTRRLGATEAKILRHSTCWTCDMRNRKIIFLPTQNNVLPEHIELLEATIYFVRVCSLKYGLISISFFLHFTFLLYCFYYDKFSHARLLLTPSFAPPLPLAAVTYLYAGKGTLLISRKCISGNFM